MLSFQDNILIQKPVGT